MYTRLSPFLRKQYSFILVVICLCVACAKTDDLKKENQTDQRNYEVTFLELQNQGEPPTEIEVSNEFIESMNLFAFDFYQIIEKQEANLLYSPVSIFQAFALLYGGADGETEDQMGRVFHFIAPEENLHNMLRILNVELLNRSNESDNAELTITNQVWGNNDINYNEDFIKNISTYYNSQIALLDFTANQENSRVIINEYIAEKTNNLIKEIIPKGFISPETKLILTNTVYFNSPWEYPFDPQDTQLQPFKTSEGNEISVPMMSQTRRLGYKKGNGYEAIELPYQLDHTKMMIILPDSDIETLENALNNQLFEDILTSLTMIDIDLTIPKFDYGSNISLKNSLIAMGMPDAFNPDYADFSKIADFQDYRLYVYDALHSAFITMDEGGTEVAVVTVIPSGLQTGTVHVKVDRPFIFIIYDKSIGAIMFIGRVMNPLLQP